MTSRLPRASALLENPGRRIPDPWFADRPTFEQACREHVAIEGDWCRILGDYWICTDPIDRSITPNLQRDGFWEAWISLALGRNIAPGMRCVDVGANVGYFTMLFADRVGEDGWVMAIEPQPGCIQRLRDTFVRNRISLRSWAIETAVSDRRERRDLLLYDSLGGSASFHICPGYVPTSSISVQTVRLDELMIGLLPIDLVKIDAEGAEVAIWDGMANTLAGSSDLIICMEVCATRPYDLGAFLHRIEHDGFSLQIVNGAGDIEPQTIEQIEQTAGGFSMLWLKHR